LVTGVLSVALPIYFFSGHNESQGWCQSDYHKAGVEEEKGSPSLQTLPKLAPCAREGELAQAPRY